MDDAIGITADGLDFAIVITPPQTGSDPCLSPHERMLIAQNIELCRLRDAINTHRCQKANDRCIEDDDRLYEALGDGVKCDRRIGCPEAMLENCRRFIQQRCEDGGPWKAYAELEAEIEQWKRRHHVAEEAVAEMSNAEVRMRLVDEWTSCVYWQARCERLESALGLLLEDTQHTDHECGDADCPVDVARKLLT